MPKTQKRTESASSASRAVATLPSDDHSLDSRDRIAMRAYELFLMRGGADGGDFDDWLAAEREIVGNASRGDAGK